MRCKINAPSLRYSTVGPGAQTHCIAGLDPEFNRRALEPEQSHPYFVNSWFNLEGLGFFILDASDQIAVHPHLVRPAYVSVVMYTIDGQLS